MGGVGTQWRPSQSGLKLARAELRGLFAPDLADRMYDAAAGAPKFLFDLTRRTGIACAAVATGTYRVAHSTQACGRSKAPLKR
jgi:hypothetical protein